jgi:hypothetical protein
MIDFIEKLKNGLLTNDQVIGIWNNLDGNDKTADLGLLVKAYLDPYYHEILMKDFNLCNLIYEGFFDDFRDPGVVDYGDDFFVTPVSKILKNLERYKDLSFSVLENKPFLVLLNTGSYSPIHMDHVLMMEEAVSVLSKDFTVLGGIFHHLMIIMYQKNM